MSVQEVIEAVKTLSPTERQQVRTLLANLTDAPSPDEVAQARLRAAGLLLDNNSRPASPSRPPLIQIKGKPLSQTIIEERG